jgi:hypothetical protein
MKNKYETKGNVTIIYLNRKNGEPLITHIDTNDLEKMKKHPYSWYAEFNESTKSYYVRSHKSHKSGRREKILLHRFIMPVGEGMVIDHVNHNTLDNRKENLRICTDTENRRNPNGLRINNKSGICGVSWNEKYKVWYVQKKINNKSIYLGQYKDKHDAEKVINIANKIVKNL